MVRISSFVFTLAVLAPGVLSFTAPHSQQRSANNAVSSTSLEMSLSQKAAIKVAGVAAGAAVAGTVFVKSYLDKGSRTYEEGSVAREYDAWADDGILEYYWGEHIHLGYYNEEEMAAGYKKKDFIEAKYDFIDEMMKFGGIDPAKDSEAKVLDVGCGFGGTSRYLAKQLGPKCSVTGITLSPKQVERGTELAQEQGVPNAKFQVTNALDMTFEDNTFDIVWACESGEHMPDKELYINEMMRVLKPGGKFVMATWCQRDDRDRPFDKKDERDLKFLYEEWTHPYFISIEAYDELLQKTNVMENIKTDDWCEPTIASWRHSIWVGVYDPRGWIFKPKKYFKCFRDGWCLERMHRAFKRGLMEYGMFAATKQAAPVEEPQEAVVEEESDS
ncbi:hydroxy-16-methoxy-2,3-dihydrotabersonine N-methyltransferase [Seminavis robusta]|uniref:Hydroxy-16-methoxy-2,3-dihydrotabersonine N-methyltransferase n=1 Tax=Seminavis robusta TaxID=568900 RepID=A0A9N8EI29_9STRA|nr:hydroxy-16-methoxy-2,3-dihydrotabersonine N-methyltransferase [Seminavis robusta]|eukprot:Sro988_g228340.1 hydroxy-16-methoxy-2,3-dihydrotabersonine N-methyltransferase (387) ;mRNA; f:12595-13891